MAPEEIAQDSTAVPIPKALQEIREHWETIYADSLTRSSFLSFEFLCLWYHCFAAEDAIRVIRLDSQGEIVGFLPLVMGRNAGRRVLTSITNRHCMHCSPLIRRNSLQQFKDQFYPALHDIQASWDVLRLCWGFSFQPEFEVISERRLSGSGFNTGRAVQPNYTIDLTRAFADYMRHDLSNNFRSNLKKARKRLERAGGGTFRHYQKDEAVSHFDEFLTIENSGWKGRTGSSIMSLAENYQRYYQGLIRLLARRNDLHLFFLDLDERPVAGMFGYTEGEVFHDFKGGYREEYRALEPSNMLLLDMIDYFMESRPDLKRFHLFPGDGGYKHRWTNESATTVEAVLYSPSLRGRCSYAASLARNRLRRSSWAREAVGLVRGWTGRGPSGRRG